MFTQMFQCKTCGNEQEILVDEDTNVEDIKCACDHTATSKEFISLEAVIREGIGSVKSSSEIKKTKCGDPDCGCDI